MGNDNIRNSLVLDCKFKEIGNDISILLESFNKNSIDGAVTALLAELACGGL